MSRERRAARGALGERGGVATGWRAEEPDGPTAPAARRLRGIDAENGVGAFIRSFSSPAAGAAG
eukprot:9466777-Pyramimonas_sp.AAC.1